MFDRAIIDTDRFMDLPMTAKALYFLLGMDADDEGFVSYKKVIRVHGGNEDDLKVLEAKCFVIRFETGVVVITDWRKNNWLDTRRIKPTEYTTERKLLAVTKDNKYTLSDCLASASPEEYRVEENSIVQNSIEEIPKKILREDSNNVYKMDTKSVQNVSSGKVRLGKVMNTSEHKDSRVNEIMEVFIKENPSIKWGNKTQRKACEEMLAKWPQPDAVKNMALQVLAVQKEKYAPRATTPLKMWEKITEFKNYFESRNVENKVTKVGL